MKVLNFCIGKIQTVQIGNAPVRTAHLKAPIPEPWVITPDGALGDERAVHPDKVYAYARTGYDHWGQYLGVDARNWPDGFFGENLTLDELDEDELRIGDVIAVGEEVRLAVAGPRNPCAKLSWRLGQPLTFQKIFQRSHRTGVYFAVVRPGTVRRGDTAYRIETAIDMPSVATVAEFAAGHTVPPLEPLKRVLAYPNLSPTIRHILTAKVKAAQLSAARAEAGWLGWRSFVVARIVEEAREVRSFYLVPSDNGSLFVPRPGSFVSVRLRDAADNAITRCWSLSHYSNCMDHYRITVRRQAGPGSNQLHRLSVGSRLSLRAPAGQFVLDLGGYRPVLLIAGGIGVTPLVAMLQAHLARGTTGIPVYLIYGTRTPADVAFREELDSLARAQRMLRVTYVYSRSDAGGRPAGRITVPLITELLSDLHVVLGERRIPLAWYENDTYLCGPGDFCQRLKAELTAQGANPDHVFSESFAVQPAQQTDLESSEIQFDRSGVQCTWRAEEDLTLLELAEQAGISVSSDCRAGSCLTCKTRVTEGSVTSGFPDGTALLCIGRPKTRLVKLDC
jgi:ferredoxin-NADP reductase/MOSC domain-containing protein YiiM